MYDEKEERRQEALERARISMANGEEYCQRCGKLCDSPDYIHLSETNCDYSGLLEGARSACCLEDLDVEPPNHVVDLHGVLVELCEEYKTSGTIVIADLKKAIAEFERTLK